MFNFLTRHVLVVFCWCRSADFQAEYEEKAGSKLKQQQQQNLYTVSLCKYLMSQNKNVQLIQMRLILIYQFFIYLAGETYI